MRRHSNHPQRGAQNPGRRGSQTARDFLIYQQNQRLRQANTLLKSTSRPANSSADQLNTILFNLIKHGYPNTLRKTGSKDLILGAAHISTAIAIWMVREVVLRAASNPTFSYRIRRFYDLGAAQEGPYPYFNPFFNPETHCSDIITQINFDAFTRDPLPTFTDFGTYLSLTTGIFSSAYALVRPTSISWRDLIIAGGISFLTNLGTMYSANQQPANSWPWEFGGVYCLGYNNLPLPNNNFAFTGELIESLGLGELGSYFLLGVPMSVLLHFIAFRGWGYLSELYHTKKRNERIQFLESSFIVDPNSSIIVPSSDIIIPESRLSQIELDHTGAPFDPSENGAGSSSAVMNSPKQSDRFGSLTQSRELVGRFKALVINQENQHQLMMILNEIRACIAEKKLEWKELLSSLKMMEKEEKEATLKLIIEARQAIKEDVDDDVKINHETAWLFFSTQGISLNDLITCFLTFSGEHDKERVFELMEQVISYKETDRKKLRFELQANYTEVLIPALEKLVVKKKSAGYMLEYIINKLTRNVQLINPHEFILSYFKKHASLPDLNLLERYAAKCSAQNKQFLLRHLCENIDYIYRSSDEVASQEVKKIADCLANEPELYLQLEEAIFQGYIPRELFCEVPLRQKERFIKNHFNLYACLFDFVISQVKGSFAPDMIANCCHWLTVLRRMILEDQVNEINTCNVASILLKANLSYQEYIRKLNEITPHKLTTALENARQDVRNILNIPTCMEHRVLNAAYRSLFNSTNMLVVDILSLLTGVEMPGLAFDLLINFVSNPEYWLVSDIPSNTELRALGQHQKLKTAMPFLSQINERYLRPVTILTYLLSQLNADECRALADHVKRSAPIFSTVTSCSAFLLLLLATRVIHDEQAVEVLLMNLSDLLTVKPEYYKGARQVARFFCCTSEIPPLFNPPGANGCNRPFFSKIQNHEQVIPREHVAFFLEQLLLGTIVLPWELNQEVRERLVMRAIEHGVVLMIPEVEEVEVEMNEIIRGEDDESDSEDDVELLRDPRGIAR